MSETRSHKIAANRIAKKFKADYNEGPGADIQTPKVAVEVETEESIGDASRQLQGFQKPVYVAGTTTKAVEKALEKYEGTTIGVMDNQGNIVKKSTRGKKR
jgi:hypothetical protein